MAGDRDPVRDQRRRDTAVLEGRQDRDWAEHQHVNQPTWRIHKAPREGDERDGHVIDRRQEREVSDPVWRGTQRLNEVNNPLVIEGEPNNVSDAVAILGTLSPARNRLLSDVVARRTHLPSLPRPVAALTAQMHSAGVPLGHDNDQEQKSISPTRCGDNAAVMASPLTVPPSFQKESLASPNSSDGNFWIRRLQQPPVAPGCADESRRPTVLPDARQALRRAPPSANGRPGGRWPRLALLEPKSGKTSAARRSGDATSMMSGWMRWLWPTTRPQRC